MMAAGFTWAADVVYVPAHRTCVEISDLKHGIRLRWAFCQSENNFWRLTVWRLREKWRTIMWQPRRVSVAESVAAVPDKYEFLNGWNKFFTVSGTKDVLETEKQPSVTASGLPGFVNVHRMLSFHMNISRWSTSVVQYQDVEHLRHVVCRTWSEAAPVVVSTWRPCFIEASRKSSIPGLQVQLVFVPPQISEEVP